MSKHTPGPWPIEGWSAGDSQGWQIRLGRHEDAQRLNIYNDSQSSECDARLIAAAPDLLEALLAMQDERRKVDSLFAALGFEPLCQESLAQAEAAIAKAKGEP